MSVTFIAEVINNGTGPAGGTSETRLLVDGTPVTPNQMTADLASAASETESWSWIATEGDHTYQVCADTDDVIAESDEANNCSALVPFSVSAQPLPDLVIQSEGMSPVSPTAGMTVTFTADVFNGGTASTAATSQTRLLIDGAPVAPNRTTGSLAPTASETENWSWTAAEGDHTYQFCADINDDILESDEANNCGTAVPFTVVPQPRPDLVVQDEGMSPPSPPAGVTVTFTADVLNGGTAATGATSQTRLLIDGTPIAPNRTTGNLPPLASETETWTWTAVEGNHTYQVCADINDEIDESDETNNCTAIVPFSVGPPLMPDLVVANPSLSPRSPTAGEVVTFTADVVNNGTASAGGSSGTRLLIDGAPIPPNQATAALAPTASETEIWSWTAVAGNHTYQICADTDDDISESDETNNCTAVIAFTSDVPPPDLSAGNASLSPPSPTHGVSVTFTAAVVNDGLGTNDEIIESDETDNCTTVATFQVNGLPDLTVQNQDLSPSAPTDGETVTFTADVVNVGSEAAGAPSRTRLLIDGAPVAPDQATGDLAATASESASWNWIALEGDHTYQVCADVDDDIGEFDEGNNCTPVVPFSVSGRPDLVSQNAGLSPPSPIDGETVTFTADVVNVGTAAAGATSQSRLLIDGTPVSPDQTTGDLAPTASETESWSWTAAVGDHTYQVCADIGDALAEFDESNNCTAAVPFSVQGQPDLEVQNDSLSPSPPTAGETVTFTATVVNIGTAAAGSSSRVRLLVDDTPVTPNRTTPDLPPGASEAEIWSWTAVEGNHTYQVCADFNDDVAESDETNNCTAVVPFNVQGRPDLVVQNESLSSPSPIDGDVVTFAADVVNAGSAAAGATSQTRLLIDGAPVSPDQATGDLAPAASEAETWSWTAVVGDHTYQVCADVNGEVAEADESNNCNAAVPFNVRAQPDLVIQNEGLSPASPNDGDAVTFTADVVNIGTAEPGATSQTRLLIDGSPISPDQTTGDLAPAASETESWSWSGAEGAHTYQICADNDNVIAEYDETNNCTAVTPFNVSGQPDLVVQNADLSPQSPSDGETVVFSGDVVNAGTGATGATSQTRLLIDGTPVSPDQTTGDLAPAASDTEAWNWTAVQGDHTYQVCADNDDDVTESDESNNCSAVEAFNVSPPPPPSISTLPNDLTFAAISGWGNPPTKTLWISNGGSQSLDWNVTVDQSWASLSPTNGSATSETDDVTVSVDVTGLGVGTHTATLTITAPGASNTPQSVGITLVISDAPSIQGVWPTNGWDQATPAEMGMDASKLIEARDYALNTGQGGGSGIITRFGRVVMSWGSQTDRQGIMSSTKSVGSTILGLAIGDGLMDLSDLAQQHHPSIGIPPQSNAATGWLDDITILHIATQTAGFKKPGGYEELSKAPGVQWDYSDGGPNWLAEALTLAYGQDLLSVLNNRLMSPMGVSPTEYGWRQNAYRDTEINGITNREFGAGISASVNALARLAYLYLREGEWDGTQILPASYVATARAPIPGIEDLPSVSTFKFANAPKHYGLLWWNNADGVMPSVPTDAYFSWGLDESFIIVIPSMDIVIARIGDAWRGDDGDPFYPVLEGFLRPIVESVVVP
jgi:subtilase family serine protease